MSKIRKPRGWWAINHIIEWPGIQGNWTPIKGTFGFGTRSQETPPGGPGSGYAGPLDSIFRLGAAGGTGAFYPGDPSLVYCARAPCGGHILILLGRGGACKRANHRVVATKHWGCLLQ